MDLNSLLKSLEGLENKKKSTNAEIDLSRECQSIEELNRRIGVLLNGIQNLKSSIDEQDDFISQTCDILQPDYKRIHEASLLFGLTSQLIKLNRLCKRIDSSRAFNYFADNQSDSSSRRSSIKNGDGNEIDELTTQADEIADMFESIYKPIESFLSTRKDLPYAVYAKKVETIRVAQSGGSY